MTNKRLAAFAVVEFSYSFSTIIATGLSLSDALKTCATLKKCQPPNTDHQIKRYLS